MANNAFQAVEDLIASVKNFNIIAKGGPTESATIDGEQVPSIRKSIKDNYDALAAMIAGRTTTETLIELQAFTPTADANGFYPAGEVWGDTAENNGLYGYDGSAWVKSEMDVSASLKFVVLSESSALQAIADHSALSSTTREMPLSNDGIDFVWGVKAGDKLLGWFDSAGKWHSDHTHDGLAEQGIATPDADAIWGIMAGDKLLAWIDLDGVFHSDHTHWGLPENFIAQPSADVIWGIKAGEKLLLWIDAEGVLHSDHGHDEIQGQIDQNTADIASVSQTVAGISVSGAMPTDLLVREITSDSTQQISAFDGDSETVVTRSGSNWTNPLVHHGDVVRCWSDATTGEYKPHTILPTGEIYPESNVLMQQLVTGQSLSLGSRGYVLNENGEYTFNADPVGVGDLFTPACPADLVDHCLTLDAGVRKAGTTLVPTAELPDGVLGETVCSSYMIGLARQIESKSYGGLPRLAAAISGTGGVPYDSLKKGTSVYTSALNKTQAIHDAAAAHGWAHVVTTVRIIHGESQSAAADPVDVTEAGYAAVLREWVSDYQADLVAITGQLQPPVGMVCQVNTQSNANIEVPLAQLKAHDENDDIILIGPKYQHPYFDSAHMLAEGYVKTGELEAHAQMHWMAGRKWQPLKPVSVTLDGSTITITTNNTATAATVAGPVGDLVIDTDQISDPGDYGFTVSDELVTINSVVASSNTITIELDAAPAAGSTISYALQTGQSQPSNGPRGNIRDSDTRITSRFDGNPIHNWLVAFRATLN